MKRCGHCGEMKPLAAFAKDSPSQRSRYGITPAQYLGMVTAQDGKCFICGLATKLHIDHDHATKEVRKLLCIGCNTSVGYLESRILRVGLKKFLLYLRRRYAA